MLDGRPAPAGEMPVVLAPGGGGILFHEACGHGLEADHIVKGASVFRGRVGERIASRLVNGVDDGSIPGAWGSQAFDDEGTRPSGPCCSPTASWSICCTTGSEPSRTAYPPPGTVAGGPTPRCPSPDAELVHPGRRSRRTSCRARPVGCTQRCWGAGR